MMLLFKVMMLVAMVRLLLVHPSPRLCAILYAGVLFFVGLLIVIGGQAPIHFLLWLTLARLLLAWGYFSLLHRLGDHVLWWPALASGGLLCFL